MRSRKISPNGGNPIKKSHLNNSTSKSLEPAVAVDLQRSTKNPKRIRVYSGYARRLKEEDTHRRLEQRLL